MAALRSLLWVLYNIALLIAGYYLAQYLFGSGWFSVYLIVVCGLVLNNIYIFMDKRKAQLVVLNDNSETAGASNAAGIIEQRMTGSQSEADTIDALLSTMLTELAAADDGQRKLYSHRSTGRLWELRQTQGRGTRQLRELSLKSPDEWR